MYKHHQPIEPWRPESAPASVRLYAGLLDTSLAIVLILLYWSNLKVDLSILPLMLLLLFFLKGKPPSAIFFRLSVRDFRTGQLASPSQLAIRQISLLLSCLTALPILGLLKKTLPFHDRISSSYLAVENNWVKPAQPRYWIKQ